MGYSSCGCREFDMTEHARTQRAVYAGRDTLPSRSCPSNVGVRNLPDKLTHILSEKLLQRNTEGIGKGGDSLLTRMTWKAFWKPS